ncbi:calcium-activated chloride channel regulator 1-like [Mya arenaria]|uniref:calcium-activated chloride channel regulator 1-like n=3 Tax=Mya arenaria TaxID=6604 RepID=UPI0022E59A20|nr:calcium-activated chloride channel regulator 1-like [Mya arenaria]
MRVLFALAFFIGVCYGVTLKDNRYEGLYVAVNELVTEDLSLIDRIKEIFTAASRLLFRATEHRVYFGEIKIIVPRSWTPQGDAQPVQQSERGYFKIEDGQLITPRTFGNDLCGQGGTYTYLPLSFVKNTSRTDFGKHENVLVHEWAQLRWGVFPEYGTDEEAKGHFYQAGGKWKPTSCSENVQGRVGFGTDCKASSWCDTNDSTRRIHPGCRFCPDLTQSVAGASIMDNQFVDLLELFCDDSEGTPVAKRHNRLATNKQNLYCDHKSVWAVMREHSDFTGVHSERLPEDTDTKPVYTILQEAKSRKVFVLDKSGSMEWDTPMRIVRLHETGKYIIENEDEICADSYLGIVWFSSSASVQKAITKVDSEATRAALVDALPTIPAGGTCIGCGLELAIDEIIKTFPTSSKHSEIILMSDGEETTNNLTITEQATRAKDLGILIHTVAISNQSSVRLADVAKITGGKSLFLEIGGNITFVSVLSKALSNSMTGGGCKSEEMRSGTLRNSSVLNFNFTIDGGMGLNTTVVIFPSNPGLHFDFEIRGEEGLLEKSLNISETPIMARLTGKLTKGTYFVVVKTKPDTAINWEYDVKSKSKDNHQVTVTTRFSDDVVYTDVLKGNAPVLNANVVATSGSCFVILRDNGKGKDITAGDGTYTGQFTCPKEGRSETRVTVKANSIIIVTGIVGAATLNPDAFEEIVIEERFERFSLVEDANLSPTTIGDTTSPGKITDLRIEDVETNGNTRHFTIRWTATGDDRYTGQATTYQFRYANDLDSLLNNFGNAQALDIGQHNLYPRDSGEDEAVDISVTAEKEFNETAFLGIRALDEVGNEGAMSNIVSIVIANGFNISFNGRTNHTYIAPPPIIDDDKTIVGLIIGVVIGTAVPVIILIAACVVINLRRHKLNNPHSTRDPRKEETGDNPSFSEGNRAYNHQTQTAYVYKGYGSHGQMVVY